MSDSNSMCEYVRADSARSADLTGDGVFSEFLSHTSLGDGDVMPVSNGSCRLHPLLARAMVAACRIHQGKLDTHARWLKDTFLCTDNSNAQALLTPERPVDDLIVAQPL